MVRLDSLPRVLRFIETKRNRSWFFRNPNPDYHTLTFVVEGRIYYTTGGHRLKMGPGDLVVSLPGLPKIGRVLPGETYTGYSFHLTAEEPLDLPVCTNYGPGSRMEELFEEAHLSWLLREPGHDWAVAGLALQILAQIRKAASEQTTNHMESRVRAVQRHIATHLEKPVDQVALAESLGLNPMYLGVLFKRRTGLSLRNYANQMRVRKAMDLLASGSLSVSAVAQRCGFTDIYYFSRVFKRWAGLSPRAFSQGGQHGSRDTSSR